MDWSKIMQYGLTFLGGGMAGAILTQICTNYRNRLQKLACNYLEDDVQSKIPVVVDNVNYGNLHLKRFQLINTTNKDIAKFSVRFVFDHEACILDFSSRTKSGDSKTTVTGKEEHRNECSLRVKDLNRGDKVDITLRIGNISHNMYYITEYESVGFKIQCRDKRKKQDKTRSKYSSGLGFYQEML